MHMWHLRNSVPNTIFYLKLNQRAVYTGALGSEQHTKANTLRKGVWKPKEIFQVSGKMRPPDCWGGDSHYKQISL